MNKEYIFCIVSTYLAYNKGWRESGEIRASEISDQSIADKEAAVYFISAENAERAQEKARARAFINGWSANNTMSRLTCQS